MYSVDVCDKVANHRCTLLTRDVRRCWWLHTRRSSLLRLQNHRDNPLPPRPPSLWRWRAAPAPAGAAVRPGGSWGRQPGQHSPCRRDRGGWQPPWNACDTGGVPGRACRGGSPDYNPKSQLPCMDCHAQAITSCAMQEDDRRGLQDLWERIRCSSLARGVTTHDTFGNVSDAYAQHGGEPGRAVATAVYAQSSGPGEEMELSNLLVRAPTIASDAGEGAGLLPVLGAWRSSDGRRLYVAFPKPDASLADLLRFDPAALSSDGAVRLLLYQARMLLVLPGQHAACLTINGTL